MTASMFTFPLNASETERMFTPSLNKEPRVVTWSNKSGEWMGWVGVTHFTLSIG